MPAFVGLDFGTTNSALALAEVTGNVSVARFASRDQVFDTFRSVLFFECEEQAGGGAPRIEAGPRAIERYLDSDGNGRLIQSVKSFLASRSFTETSICGEPYTLEDLIGIIARRMRTAAEEQFAGMGQRLVAGRPVHFASQNPQDQDGIAEARLRRALARAGYDEVHFVFEPVAAAYDYESRLDHDQLVLIADFGGGTSDFSVLHVGPSYHHVEPSRRQILAVDGVGIAGDVFDARIIRHVVSPRLGLGSSYRSVNQLLEMPSWLYSHLERWHFLSLLKSPKNLRLLEKLRYQAVQPETIEAFLHVVVSDLGFHLYQAVNRLKAELSTREKARLRFVSAPVQIDCAVARADFEHWIAADLERIAACVDRTVAAAAVQAAQIDRVFMTGGSSFVPAVRRIFAERFGAERLSFGNEFVSVARGLALCARDLFA